MHNANILNEQPSGIKMISSIVDKGPFSGHVIITYNDGRVCAHDQGKSYGCVFIEKQGEEFPVATWFFEDKDKEWVEEFAKILESGFDAEIYSVTCDWNSGNYVTDLSHLIS